MQYQKPVVIQDQRFKMNPQLLQSIQLMAMPIQELKLTIREEIEKNPASRNLIWRGDIFSMERRTNHMSWAGRPH